MGEAGRTRWKVLQPASVVVLAAALLVAAGCSSNGVVGSGSGPHVPPAPAGDFTAFLVHHGGDPAVYHELINGIHDVGGKWLTVEAQMSGTLVVGLKRDAPADVRSQIEKDLSQSLVVDHVVRGGCDKQPTVCESWRSTLGPG